jgi:hypothetical protein
MDRWYIDRRVGRVEQMADEEAAGRRHELFEMEWMDTLD